MFANILLCKCWTLDAQYVSGVQRPAFAQRFQLFDQISLNSSQTLCSAVQMCTFLC
jgi:hypothetical protein